MTNTSERRLTLSTHRALGERTIFCEGSLTIAAEPSRDTRSYNKWQAFAPDQGLAIQMYLSQYREAAYILIYAIRQEIAKDFLQIAFFLVNLLAFGDFFELCMFVHIHCIALDFYREPGNG